MESKNSELIKLKMRLLEKEKEKKE